MHGGLKVYAGAPAAARHYVEADRGRADDYYLAEGTGVARRFTAGSDRPVMELAPLTGDAYEAWVAGHDPDTGVAARAAAQRDAGGAVRGGGGQRPEVLVARGRAAPGHREGVRRRRRTAPPPRSSAGSPEHATTRVGPARRPGAGPGRGAGGGDGAALHLPGGRSAPASAPADQRPGVRRREMARPAHRRRPGLAGGDQRDRACRDGARSAFPCRAGRARLHHGRDWRNTGSSPSMWAR